jgi:hypothetical protein
MQEFTDEKFLSIAVGGDKFRHCCRMRDVVLLDGVPVDKEAIEVNASSTD